MQFSLPSMLSHFVINLSCEGVQLTYLRSVKLFSFFCQYEADVFLMKADMAVSVGMKTV